MEKYSCFELLAEVLLNASRLFGPQYDFDGETFLGMEVCCQAVESLFYRFGGREFGVNVDRDTKEIVLYVTCLAGMDLSDKNGLFYAAQLKAKKFRGENIKEEEEKVLFWYESLWEKVR